jgi:hypothetical protein
MLRSGGTTWKTRHAQCTQGTSKSAKSEFIWLLSQHPTSVSACQLALAEHTPHLRSLSPLPAFKMNGTPSHRSLRILSTAMQNVGVRESCAPKALPLTRSSQTSRQEPERKSTTV